VVTSPGDVISYIFTNAGDFCGPHAFREFSIVELGLTKWLWHFLFTFIDFAGCGAHLLSDA